MKKLIYLLIIYTWFCACDKETESESKTNIEPDEEQSEMPDSSTVAPSDIRLMPSKSYIDLFIKPDSIAVGFANEDHRLENSVHISLVGTCYAPYFYGLHNYAQKIGADHFVYDYKTDSILPVGYVPKSDKTTTMPLDKSELASAIDENIKVFTHYSELLGDTSFTGEIAPLSNCAIADSISSIDIITNENFDAKHKKGDSVSDIVTFYGSTPYNYVTTGYNWPKQTIKPSWYYQYNDLVVCKVNEIARMNLKFFSNYFHLKFDQLPDNPGTYTFDVVIKFTDKELKNTVTMQF